MKMFKRVLVYIVCLVIACTPFSHSSIRAEAATSKNFPNFDLNVLDIDSIPGYIWDIINADDGFVMVRVSSDLFNVVVARNVYLYAYVENMDLIGSFYVGTSTEADSICYSANYTPDGQIYSSGWAEVKPQDFTTYWVDTSLYPNFRRFGSNYNDFRNTCDFYFYGATTYSADTQFGFGVANNTRGVVGFNDSAANLASIFNSYTNIISGAGYFSALTSFPTYESQQASTQKGIWQSIKDLPGQIANSIGGFFTTLKNYLLWFNADGADSYTNPFANILDDIQSFFDDQISDTNDFKSSLNTTLDNVVSYIQNGSSIISAVLTGVPILSAFVMFFVIFAIVRKVVGR